MRVSWTTNTCVLLAISLKRKNILIVTDPGETSTQLKTSIKRIVKESEGKVNRFKKVDILINNMFEMGLNEKAYDLQAFTIKAFFSLQQEGEPSPLQLNVRECLANVIEIPHPVFLSKTIGDFASLFKLFIFAIIPILFVLLIEICLK